MLTEKKIYQAWKQRFGFPEIDLEKTSHRVLSHYKASSISARSVDSRFKTSKLTIFGDDALAASHKDLMISFLSKINSNRKVILTNRIDRVHREKMNRYLHGKISLENFFQSIDISWVEKKAYGKILTFLKNKKYEIVLSDGDELASQAHSKLGEYSQVIVWTGRLRLYSREFTKKISGTLLVDLQCNPLRWKSSRPGKWKKIGKNRLGYTGFSPLVSMDLFRISEDYEDNLCDVAQILAEFEKALKFYSKRFEPKKVPAPEKIFHPFSLDSLEKINRLKKRKKLFQFLKNRVLRGESAVIPRERIVLLSSLRISDLSEEVVHYLRNFDFSGEFGFLGTVVEEAWAFFASLLRNPHRELPELPKHPTSWDRAHFEGYMLGLQLFRSWTTSKKLQSRIENMWLFRPRDEIEAHEIYDKLSRIR